LQHFWGGDGGGGGEIVPEGFEGCDDVGIVADAYTIETAVYGVGRESEGYAGGDEFV